VVFGSEGSGIRPSIEELCTDVVKIEQSPRLSGSLNVGVAAGTSIANSPSVIVRCCDSYSLRDNIVPYVKIRTRLGRNMYDIIRLQVKVDLVFSVRDCEI